MLPGTGEPAAVACGMRLLACVAWHDHNLFLCLFTLPYSYHVYMLWLVTSSHTQTFHQGSDAVGAARCPGRWVSPSVVLGLASGCLQLTCWKCYVTSLCLYCLSSTVNCVTVRCYFEKDSVVLILTGWYWILCVGHCIEFLKWCSNPLHETYSSDTVLYTVHVEILFS